VIASNIHWPDTLYMLSPKFQRLRIGALEGCIYSQVALNNEQHRVHFVKRLFVDSIHAIPCMPYKLGRKIVGADTGTVFFRLDARHASQLTAS
jgi:hypothetical protein